VSRIDVDVALPHYICMTNVVPTNHILTVVRKLEVTVSEDITVYR